MIKSEKDYIQELRKLILNEIAAGKAEQSVGNYYT